MYKVSQFVISDARNWSYKYCSDYATLSWHLYNAALFRIRQCFTGYDKVNRSDNEKKVFDEIALLIQAYPSVKVKKVISYKHLDKLMRVTKNPDYFAGLPMQTAEAVIKSAVQDFKNWLAALRLYKQDPSRFLGKPKMPGYKKSPCTFTITNQDAVIYGTTLKLPCTKNRLNIQAPSGALKEVKIIPYYGRFIVSLTTEDNTAASTVSGTNTAGIDFGTDNFAAIVSTDGSSKLYKGGAVLSSNQYFAKNRADAVGIITRGHDKMFATSKHLDNLSYRHANFTNDQLHKISRDIVSWCLLHNVSTLVLGENKLWKQESDIGCANNQKFVQMPITKLKWLIEYKACLSGITVVRQEESYTSKASFIDGDAIPVYGIDDGNVSFSGKRIKRGLYKTMNGLVINADLNGAANIIKKAFSDAWKYLNMSDEKALLFLSRPEVSGFHELNS